MNNWKRRLAGKLAKKAGEAFENMWEAKCHRVGIATTRIPDGCKQLPRKIIRVKSPFDWFMSYQCRAFALDTKTNLELSFPHSKIDRDQVDNLLAHQRQGTLAGYVIYLRTQNAVIYVNVNDLDRRLKDGRGSIHKEDPDAVYLGNCVTFDPLILFK